MVTFKCTSCNSHKNGRDFDVNSRGVQKKSCRECLNRKVARCQARQRAQQEEEDGGPSDIQLVERFLGDRRQYSNNQVR